MIDQAEQKHADSNLYPDGQNFIKFLLNHSILHRLQRIFNLLYKQHAAFLKQKIDKQNQQSKVQQEDETKIRENVIKQFYKSLSNKNFSFLINSTSNQLDPVIKLNLSFGQSPQKIKDVNEQAFKLQYGLLNIKLNQVFCWLKSYFEFISSDHNKKEVIKNELQSIFTIFDQLCQNMKNKQSKEQQHNYYLMKLLKHKDNQKWTSEFMTLWLNKKKMQKVYTNFLKSIIQTYRLLTNQTLTYVNLEANTKKVHYNQNAIQNKKQVKQKQHTPYKQYKKQVISIKTIRPVQTLKSQFIQRIYKLSNFAHKKYEFVGQNETKRKINGVQIAKILATAQGLFIKDILKKAIQISKFRNSKLDSQILGNQIKYFSEQNKEVQNLVSNKFSLFTSNSLNNIQLSQKKVKLVTYPSKLQQYFRLKCRQQQRQQEMLETLRLVAEDSKQQMFGLKNPLVKKNLLKYFENENQIEQTNRIEQIIGGKSKRLTISIPALQKVIRENYQWLFCYEQSFYRF